MIRTNNIRTNEAKIILSLWPYGWFWKNWKKLPEKEKFYSFLNNIDNNDKEYGDILNVWNKFEVKKIKGYHQLYIKCNCY